MSYISTIRKNDKVYVWERSSRGRIVKTYDAPFYFYKKDPNGKYESIFGDKLSKYEFPDFYTFQDAVNKLKGQGVQLFESDVLPEQRILSQYYYEAEPPPLNITFLDIEVNYDTLRGFASVDNPYAPINSTALYHQHQNKYILLAVPPEGVSAKNLREDMNAIEPLPTDSELEIQICSSEIELLMWLLAEIEDSDVLSGWNSEFYDLPYIAKRLEKIGPKTYNRLSFPDAHPPRPSSVERMGRTNSKVVISGRIALDYLDLYKKYEMGDRPSYKLESIADEVLPDMPKLEYEGSLTALYQTNFPYFLRYNLRDTEILKGFEDRLGYVALANTMAHISTGTFDNVLGTIKLSEHAINNYCWHVLGKQVPDTPRPENTGIQGALVLDPKVGMHEWIGSVDINSLYPSAIRSINISSETIIGQFIETTEASKEIAKESTNNITLVYENGKEETHSAFQWRQILQTHKWSVSGFGTVFDQAQQGIIPAVLESWYITRKKYQKLKKEAMDNLQSAYYDRLQYVYKIKLNSLYGALSNRFFRFFDTRMGESTTGTGRIILQHQCCQVNKLLTKEYNLTGDAIIYGDTDSTYFKTFAENKGEAILIADTISDQVNKSFPPFMRQTFLCQPGYDDIIRCGREIVSDRGIFVDKKRYILHVVDNEGTPADKLKVMGLDTKKTTMPKIVSITLNKFIERLLKGDTWDNIANDIVDYKEYLLQNEDVRVIGLPKGIKGIEEYTKKYEDAEKQAKKHKESNNCVLPGHIAAAICYNKCLDTFNDMASLRITSGMKIKVFYLTHTLFDRFTSIALPTDIEVVPDWFYNNCEVDKEKHITRLVDNPLRNIVKAINKIPPSKQERMFSSIMGDDVCFESTRTIRIKKEKVSDETQNIAAENIFGMLIQEEEKPKQPDSIVDDIAIKKHKQNKLADDIFGL